MQRPLIVCLCGLFLVWSATAADDESPQAIIKKAIKAHGGEANLAKTLRGKATYTITTYWPADQKPKITEMEEVFDLPNRYWRKTTKLVEGSESVMVSAVVDGAVWVDVPGEDVVEFNTRQQWLGEYWQAVLATLPRNFNGRITLASAGKEKAGERELIGVQASFSGGVLWTQYFNAQSAMLHKAKRKITLPDSSQSEGELEYADYKEVSGVKFPHQITMRAEGKAVVETKVAKLEFLDKVDDKLFEKPKR